jgi:hypothetical protein
MVNCYRSIVNAARPARQSVMFGLGSARFGIYMQPPAAAQD